ncbi:2-C-methyl-D-erythritol 4-phosphate cytidylyltransferase [Actinotalea sp. K2]|uniref:2-C-methyl-D-erythritol 4-phosphate cytidylyltransferase n=1 Tax=Actinotalea sp. K2 TaxID=2939438 RepID=UPI00201834E2|nr:2-C-methyl-D-erythritol 4-phosphate cytidylyltransferase [Actinotalea sp. K2]MCL3861490.1 2-C-methyl-D-erythritol 4-phosphate cytidylyltransferase [Actinotalea sp. K2]
MRVAAILTAAGSGTRLGHDLPKALVPLGGVPLVLHAARGLADSGVVDLVVVTVPRGSDGAFATAMTQDAGRLGGMTLTLAVGGTSRQASVAAGLAEVPADVDLVLVHDAARPLTPARLVAEVVAAVRAGHRAVIPVVPVTDSVVDVADGDVRPVDRSTLRGVQTPQGFDRALLDRAHAAAAHRATDEHSAATDDASLCALLGAVVHAIPGADDAFKITTPRDLALAEMLLSEVPA